MHVPRAWPSSTAPPADDRPGCTSGPSAWAAGTVDYGRVAGALGRRRQPLQFTRADRRGRPGAAAWRAQRHRARARAGPQRDQRRARPHRLALRQHHRLWIVAGAVGVRVNAALGQALTLLDSQRLVSGDGLAVHGAAPRHAALRRAGRQHTLRRRRLERVATRRRRAPERRARWLCGTRCVAAGTRLRRIAHGRAATCAAALR